MFQTASYDFIELTMYITGIVVEKSDFLFTTETAHVLTNFLMSVLFKLNFIEIYIKKKTLCFMVTRLEVIFFIWNWVDIYWTMYIQNLSSFIVNALSLSIYSFYLKDFLSWHFRNWTLPLIEFMNLWSSVFPSNSWFYVIIFY